MPGGDKEGRLQVGEWIVNPPLDSITSPRIRSGQISNPLKIIELLFDTERSYSNEAGRPLP